MYIFSLIIILLECVICAALLIAYHFADKQMNVWRLECLRAEDRYARLQSATEELLRKIEGEADKTQCT